MALIPSARSAAVSIARGPEPMPTRLANSGRHKSSQSLGGVSRNELGSLSFLYAMSVHPHLYGTPYIAGFTLLLAMLTVVFVYVPPLFTGLSGWAGRPVRGSRVPSSLHTYGSRAYHSLYATDVSKGRTRPCVTAAARNSSPTLTTSALANLGAPLDFFLSFFEGAAIVGDEVRPAMKSAGDRYPPGGAVRVSSSNISPGDGAVVTAALPFPTMVLLNSPSHCVATEPRSAMTCSCTGNVYAVWSSPSYMSSSLASDGGAPARKESAEAGARAYPASAARRV